MCALNVIDALSIDDRTTAFNLYMTGMIDWVTVPPAEVLREFMKQQPPPQRLESGAATHDLLLSAQQHAAAARRQARAASARRSPLDREEITRVATGAGEVPALSLVPPSMPGYKPQPCQPFNPEAARKLLAEAGYPDGRGFPKLEILYNTDQAHQAIAELLRKQWQKNLGITASLRNEEWGSFRLAAAAQLHGRPAGWVGDYSIRIRISTCSSRTARTTAPASATPSTTN